MIIYYTLFYQLLFFEESIWEDDAPLYAVCTQPSTSDMTRGSTIRTMAIPKPTSGVHSLTVLSTNLDEVIPGVVQAQDQNPVDPELKKKKTLNS